MVYNSLRGLTKTLAVFALTLSLTAGCSESDTDQAATRPDGTVELPDDMAIGSPDAPVTIIEYASVTCGHCATFHATVFKDLEESYIDTGKVRLIFREFPTQPTDRAMAGFMLARCVPEERYFGFIDVLMKTQRDWVIAPNAFEELKKIANNAGMSDDMFIECLNRESEIERIRDNSEAAMETYGITGTPSFVINGKTYSNMPFSEFQSILDPLLGE